MQETNAALLPDLSDSAASQASSVVTHMVFRGPLSKVWEGLRFFEELDERPPLLLRMLLPTPIRTEGKNDEVGNEVMCQYEGGHLLKRVTHLERERRYAFEVIEQALDVGGAMRLLGGHYEMRVLDSDRTDVSVETRYVSKRWPRQVFGPIERLVCHMFHRYLLGSMKRKIES